MRPRHRSRLDGRIRWSEQSVGDHRSFQCRRGPIDVMLWFSQILYDKFECRFVSFFYFFSAFLRFFFSSSILCRPNSLCSWCGKEVANRERVKDRRRRRRSVRERGKLRKKERKRKYHSCHSFISFIVVVLVAGLLLFVCVCLCVCDVTWRTEFRFRYFLSFARQQAAPHFFYISGRSSSSSLPSETPMVQFHFTGPFMWTTS